MTQGTREWYGFGILQAWLSTYVDATPASWVELPVISGAAMTTESTEEVVRDGMGNPKTTWYHSRGITFELTMEKWAMRILEMATGNPVSSQSGVDKLEFGRDEELTPPLLQFKFRAQATTALGGTTQYYYVYLYKCQCSPPDLGMNAVTPNRVVLRGRALQSTQDDAGATIPNQSLGRLESSQAT